MGCERGGGVLIAARRDFAASSIATPAQKDYEDVWIRVVINNHKLIIGCVYIPPNSGFDTYQSVGNTCESLHSIYQNHTFLICGDFNLPLITWTYEDGSLFPRGFHSPTAETLINAIYSIELQQVNHIRNSLGRTLDLLFADMDSFSDLTVEISVDPLLPADKFHPAIETAFSFAQTKTKTLRSGNRVRVYNFHRANYTELNDFFERADWSFISASKDVDIALSRFYEVLSEGISRFVPGKVIVTSKYPRWFDSGLRRCITLKNNLYKKFKRSGQSRDYEAFSEMRREVKARTEICYLMHITKIENLIPENLKYFWSFIRNLKNDSNLPAQMKYNGINLDNPGDISESFASHFRASYSDHNNVDLSTIQPVSFATLLCSHRFEVEEIIDKMKQLDASKSAGPDGIPNEMLKNCCSSLALPLQNLFQRSFNSGCFPNLWKFSNLIPIYKSGDKSDIANYRGISIISAIPKLFESILTDEIFWTFKRYIIPEQTGFYRDRSAATNLAVYQNYLVSSIEAGFQVDSIYTDLSKAFDSVHQPLLLKKLSEMGIQGNYLKWVKSYLTDRRQRVEICGSLSGEVLVTSGVPQGSHIGPILFSLFVNDVASCFESSRFLLYADDLKIFGTLKADSARALQGDLDRFTSWCSSNMLRLNISKCKTMSFFRTTRPAHHIYTIEGQPLEAVEQINDLGVTFDQNLSFNTHIDNIIVKSLRMLGFVKRNAKHMNDTKAITCLYFSLVRSFLEYCSVVWSPSYATHRKRLEGVQNKFLKFLLYKHRFPSSGIPYEVRLMLCGIKSLESRRRDALFLFLYKLLNNKLDCTELLEAVRLLIPARQTRQRQLFHEEYHRTNYGSAAFVDRMVKNYNAFYPGCDVFNDSLTQIRNQIAFK